MAAAASGWPQQPTLFDLDDVGTAATGETPCTPQPPEASRALSKTLSGGIDFAALWAEMGVGEIPLLLRQSDTREGRRKIADMIARNRPDLAGRVEADCQGLCAI